MSARSPRCGRRVLATLLLLVGVGLGGCQAAENLMYEPKPQDPNDGYKGSLAEAGSVTEMDWGPKQELLLSDFRALKEEHARLQKRMDQMLGEEKTLKAQLGAESDALAKEKAMRLQAEAESEMLRQKRRELEARILSLSIEKAKLEQTALLAKIAELQRSMEEAGPAPATPADASAAPGGR